MIAFIRSLLKVGRLRIGVAMALMVLFSFSEGVGIALLLPILEASGVNLGAQGTVGHYERDIMSWLHAIGIHPSLLALLIAFAALVGARALLGRWQAVAIYSTQQNFAVRMRSDLYDVIANANWMFLSRMRSTDLTHALTSEVERIETASFNLMNLVSTMVLLTLYLAIALAVSVSMTLLVLACGALLVAMLRGRTSALHIAGAELSERTKRLYATTIEHLQSLKAAKMYGVQERNVEHFSLLSAEVSRADVDIMREEAAAISLFEIGSVAILVVVLYISIRVLGVAPFAILLLLAMFARVMPRVMAGHRLYQEFMQGLPSFENVMRLAARCAAAAEPAGALDAPLSVAFKDALRLEKVSFSYQENKPPVVQNLDLIVPAGEVVALVGRSGAGKSTIVDLMSGLLSPDSGRVTIDGMALDESHARGWREQVGYVSQETYLFHDTVRANLLWARPDAREADLRNALKLAAADQFVDALPHGLDSVLGDRGAAISHGERQRIALARALLRRPRLLILDEATNSLDAHNEERILNEIERLSVELAGELTIVTIAHRIAAVRRAHLIYVIESGEVVESGSWDELCAIAHGRFRALCESQGIAPLPVAPQRPAVAKRLA